MEKAILARHGESEFSARGALNGDTTVRCGLTPAGLEQARLLGEMVRDEALGLCMTSEFERARATADEALRGRDLPRLVLAGLDDPLYGPYEGAQLEEFRAWASTASSTDSPGPGGESRLEIVARYARAFRTILERPEETILVVSHSLPVVYALAARDGIAPTTTVVLAEYAMPHSFEVGELERAVDVLERWLAAPSW
jgi:broad specificity phosphatase PhoE